MYNNFHFQNLTLKMNLQPAIEYTSHDIKFFYIINNIFFIWSKLVVLMQFWFTVKHMYGENELKTQ